MQSSKDLIHAVLDVTEALAEGDREAMHRNDIMREFFSAETPEQFQKAAPKMLEVLDWMFEVAKEGDPRNMGEISIKIHQHKRGIREANRHAAEDGRAIWNNSDLQVAIREWTFRPVKVKADLEM